MTELLYGLAEYKTLVRVEKNFLLLLIIGINLLQYFELGLIRRERYALFVSNNLLFELNVKLLLHVNEVSREVELWRNVVAKPLLMLLLVEIELFYDSVLNELLIT